MDRLSPQDASFLHVEGESSHMHIGSVAILNGPAPFFDDVMRMIRSKLPLVPRYRQKVRFVPFELGRPVWIDDPHFNLSYHLRHTALPTPGSDEQLRNLVGRLMSQQLDRSKPLWEIWIVEGLADGHWAIVSKVHHCMVDGVASTDLMTVLFDTEPEPKVVEPGAWHPDPEPSDRRLLADAVRERLTSPYEQVRALNASLRSGRRLVSSLTQVARGAASTVGVLRKAAGEDSSLSGVTGPHRRWAWARTTLPEIKAVRAALGGTVNDVVLTAITRGFRDLLISRGEDVHDRVVRTLVPVSVRSADERGTYNNRVSGMIAQLPVGIDDPVERLAAIKIQMDEVKSSGQAVAAEALMALGDFAPPALLALGTRLASRAVSRVGPASVDTVTTNVPGPQFPLYAVGKKMIELFPYVPVGAPIRIGIAIFSYDGKMTFGVTGDRDSAPDIDVLCAGIEDGMRELEKASSG
jgi:diacylglycerol O-acyltransferase / wax synthase